MPSLHEHLLIVLLKFKNSFLKMENKSLVFKLFCCMYRMHCFKKYRKKAFCI